MPEREIAELIGEYFDRLETALAPLPPGQRAQLFEELRSHVEQARLELPEESEVAILDLLDRLGDPQDIADQAIQDFAYDTEEIDFASIRQAATDSEHAPSVREKIGRRKQRGSGPARIAAAVLAAVVLASLAYFVWPSGGGRSFPVATSVEPGSGQSPCGTIVSIAGSGFGSSTKVAFGNTLASMVKVVSPTLLTAMSPPMTPGTAVRVKVWNGSSVVPTIPSAHFNPNLQFTYYSSAASGGYRLMSADGAIYSYGDDCYLGAPIPGSHSAGGLASLVTSIDGRGYWEVAADGTVEGFGDVTSFAPKGRLKYQVVGLAPTRDGNGYWLVDSQGDVVACGDAPEVHTVSQPFAAVGRKVVSVAPDNGAGLWLLWSDGTVTGYGDATPLMLSGDSNTPSAGMPVAHGPASAIGGTSDGKGYWVVFSDGTVESNGDATLYGLSGVQAGLESQVSAGTGASVGAGSNGGLATGTRPYFGSGNSAARPVSIVGAPGNTGYWVFYSDGTVVDYGSAQPAGSIGADGLPSPIVSAAG